MSEDNGKIYMYVTDDKYELPLFFASTIKGLSEIMGVTQNAISSALSHAKEKGRAGISA